MNNIEELMQIEKTYNEASKEYYKDRSEYYMRQIMELYASGDYEWDCSNNNHLEFSVRFQKK